MESTHIKCSSTYYQSSKKHSVGVLHSSMIGALKNDIKREIIVEVRGSFKPPSCLLEAVKRVEDRCRVVL